MGEYFDAIVVGAGPAGSAAAYSMAKYGLKVLMIERGEYPGSKNMFGGMIYCNIISKVFQGFLEEAPIERLVTNQRITIGYEDSSVSFSFNDLGLVDPPVNSCTVLRSKFDRWLANKAEEAGALLLTDTVVDDFVWKQEKIIGVKVRRQEGEVYSDVVIIADGANSLLVTKAHLADTLRPDNFTLGVKELMVLPQEVINERFNLSGNNGAAYLFIGCVKGLEGGGFVYTNKKSVSVGIVCQLNSMISGRSAKTSEIIEEFKKSWPLRELIKDGVVKEYSARLISEGGYKSIPKLYSDGVLVVGSAAGFVINNGVTLRGVDLAVASGVAAANTVKMAKEKGDMSRSTLSKYEDFLREQAILQDLITYKRAPDFMKNTSLYNELPKLVCDVAREIFTVSDGPRKKTINLVKNVLKENLPMWQFLKLMIQAGRSI